MPVNNQRADRGKNRKRGNAPVETLEEKRTRLAKELGLRPKTKELVDTLIENPHLTQKEVYKSLHPKASDKTAEVNASQILSKASVQIYKDSAIKKAKRRIVSLVDSSNESISLKASQDILDRTEGKATQKTEHTSKTVRVMVDLGHVRLGNHYLSTPIQVENEAPES